MPTFVLVLACVAPSRSQAATCAVVLTRTPSPGDVSFTQVQRPRSAAAPATAASRTIQSPRAIDLSRIASPRKGIRAE